MVTVTGTAVPPTAPTAIFAGLKAQVTVESGRPLQAKVMGTSVVLEGFTVNVDVVDCPARGTEVKAVGLVKVKLGATMV